MARITISLGTLTDSNAVKFVGEIYQQSCDSKRIIIRVRNMETAKSIMYARALEGKPIVFVNECYDTYRLMFRRGPGTHIYISGREEINFKPFTL